MPSSPAHRVPLPQTSLPAPPLHPNNGFSPGSRVDKCVAPDPSARKRTRFHRVSNSAPPPPLGTRQSESSSCQRPLVSHLCADSTPSLEGRLRVCTAPQRPSAARPHLRPDPTSHRRKTPVLSSRVARAIARARAIAATRNASQDCQCQRCYGLPGALFEEQTGKVGRTAADPAVPWYNRRGVSFLR